MSNRRVHGEGSIRQLKSGKWQGCISMGFTVGGKRRRKYVFGATRRQVTDRLAALRSQTNKIKAFDARKMIVEQMTTRWLADREPSIQPSTHALYSNVISRWISPKLGHLFASAITSDWITEVLEDKRVPRRQAQTAHFILRSVFSKALMMGIVPSNPSATVQQPFAPKKQIMRALNQEEAKKFIEAARETKHAPLLILAITTGMRRGELLGFQWSDVDLVRGYVSLRRAVTTLAGKTMISPLKTPKSRRRINLTPIAIAALVEQKQSAVSEWAFANECGGPMCPSNVYHRQFLSVIKAAGLPRIRFHDLRHTAATLLLELGISAKVVSEMLRHTSLSMTLDTYSHVTPTMQRKAAAKIQSVFEPAPQVKIKAVKRVRPALATQLAHGGARADNAPKIEKSPIALATGV
jgi:integrase